jgi:hypothetical protein
METGKNCAVEVIMNKIKVNVSLYGDIAKMVSGHAVHTFDTDLPEAATVLDLLNQFDIPTDKQGYTFINAVLCDMPGLGTSHDEVLSNGDHVGIFSLTHVWPFQYRNGAAISDALRAALVERGAMHHTY